MPYADGGFTEPTGADTLGVAQTVAYSSVNATFSIFFICIQICAFESFPILYIVEIYPTRACDHLTKKLSTEFSISTVNKVLVGPFALR